MCLEEVPPPNIDTPEDLYNSATLYTYELHDDELEACSKKYAEILGTYESWHDGAEIDVEFAVSADSLESAAQLLLEIGRSVEHRVVEITTKRMDMFLIVPQTRTSAFSLDDLRACCRRVPNGELLARSVCYSCDLDYWRIAAIEGRNA